MTADRTESASATLATPPTFSRGAGGNSPRPGETHTWVYATANLLIGGGDQVLLSHARALAGSSHRIVLFSLLPVEDSNSSARELRSLGVRIENSAKADSLMRLVVRLLKPVFLVAGLCRVVGRRGEAAGGIFQRLVYEVRELGGVLTQRLRRRLLRRRVAAFLASHRVAGIHVFHAATCDALGPLLVKCGVPTVYTELTSPLGYGHQHFNPLPYLPRLSEVVVPAEGIARQLRQKLAEAGVGGTLSHVRVIPFAVPIPDSAEAAAFHADRQHYGLIGRLSVEKGHGTLIEAAKFVRDCVPGSRLLLAGTGPYEALLRRRVAELGIADHVEFLGRFEEVTAVLARLDVVVLPSQTEGMPLVLLEAMAFGKPIVATPVGAVPEMVADGESGFLVPVSDSEDLAERIVRLLLDVNLRKQMGEQGRERYRRLFDAADVAAKIRDLHDRHAGVVL